LEAVCDTKVDWLEVIAQANKHFVASALWSTLGRPELCEKLHSDVRSYLLLLYQHNASRNSRIRQQCTEIGLTLSKSNIRAVLLKGVAWLFDGSVAPASDRMMLDIDLLVAAQHVEPAVNALMASKYHQIDPTVVEVGHFHDPPLMPEQGEACVEIHRDLSYRTHLLPARDVIDGAKQVAPGLFLPTVGHRILHNVIHAQIENGDRAGGVLNMRDILDLARLLAACGPDFAWATFANEARERGLFSYLSGAMHGAHRTLESPLPSPFAENLSGRIHSLRCIAQRRCPRLGNIAEKFGLLARALAWERNAYALNLKTRKSLRAQVLVNSRRMRRIKAALTRGASGQTQRRSDRVNINAM
jgi:hypothetical protein